MVGLGGGADSEVAASSGSGAGGYPAAGIGRRTGQVGGRW